MRKILIIGVVLIFSVIVVFFSLNTLRHRQRTMLENSARDRNEAESAQQALETDKKYLRSMAVALGANYFSRQAETIGGDISLFMYNQVSAVAKTWGVQVIGFSPGGREEKGAYAQISFEGEISAPYPNMVNFFRELEEKERLSIDMLKVTASRDPLQRRARFSLCCREFHDPLFENLSSAEQAALAPSPQDHAPVAKIERDPFFNPVDASLSASSRPEKIRPGDFFVGPEDLKLTGIISSPPPGAAVINHTLVRPGDRIYDREVLEIKEDRVVIKGAEQVYVLELQEAVVPHSDDINAVRETNN
ncbi:MAG: hypothetical protein JXD19_00785 [Deltaproteobacteria bacterium]|nr:hypothetical protein [Deltaproteobacteria bacterium]